MNRKVFLSITFFVLAIATGYAQQKNVNVLFVGNSLTYQNNLPELVKKIAASDNVRLSYKMIALPNYALEDHWNDGIVNTEIKSEKYNYVIVQQGPSSQPEGYKLLEEYGIKFSQLSNEHHAHLVFYMVWPAKTRLFDFPGVYKSYKNAAEQTQSIFSPAGQAWLTVWKTDPDFSLYDPDNFHPNDRGTLLAALVIYGSISGKSDLRFIDLNSIKLANLSSKDFKLLTRAAEQTLTQEK